MAWTIENADRTAEELASEVGVTKRTIESFCKFTK
jgi:predicted transcriptional regulator